MSNNKFGPATYRSLILTGCVAIYPALSPVYAFETNPTAFAKHSLATTILLKPWLGPQPTPPEMTDLAKQIFTKTVLARRQAGKSALKENSELALVAASHSQEMASRHYFAHVSPDGISSSDRVQKALRRAFGEVAENIAETSAQADIAQSVMVLWLNSPGHKANILRTDSTDLGVGCAQNSEGMTYCTQVFMHLRASLAEPFPELVKAEDTIALTLSTVTGQTTELSIKQIKVPDGAQAAQANLQAANNTAQGELTVAGQPGLYRLELVLPDKDNPGKLLLISGPYLVVQ